VRYSGAVQTTTRPLVLAALLASIGCTPVAATDDASVRDASRPDANVDAWFPSAPGYDETHTFPAIDLDVGAERLDDCQAWTLNNDEPIYVTAVTMDAGPGWHHSNWMFVPDTLFPGDDGTFRCRDRMFDELSAALGGGGVFFAQSTQSTHEEQRFEPGAAYMIPAHARIVGSVHVFNLTGAPLSTALSFHVEGLPSTEVETLLQPLALDDRGLDLAPHSTTETTMDCDLAHFGALSMRVHYVLPHYHGLATGFRLAVVGGPRDGETIFETNAAIGDPLGSTLDVPFDMTGARGMRLTCTYENPTDGRVQWGPYRVDEMCMVLAYLDGPRSYAGEAPMVTSTEMLADGTVRQTGTCITLSN
jgi:hypothetical protein